MSSLKKHLIFQGKFEIIRDIASVARHIQHSQLAKILAERTLRSLHTSILIDIGLIRKVLLSTDFAHEVLKFEASLIDYLKSHDKTLKARVEKYMINLGQDEKKPVKKNWFAALWDSIKSKFHTVVGCFKALFH